MPISYSKIFWAPIKYQLIPHTLQQLLRLIGRRIVEHPVSSGVLVGEGLLVAKLQLDR